MLNANGEPDRFSTYGLPVVADSVEGFAGPLAGVLAGLDWAARHHGHVPWRRERRDRHALPAARSRHAAACGADRPAGATRLARLQAGELIR